MNARHAAILKKAELLELEAEVQRATLAATLKQWEQQRALSYATSIGTVAMGLLKVPQIRWLVMANIFKRFRKRKHKDKETS